MIPAEEIMNNKYNEIYDEELRGLERRRARDPALTVDMLQETLKALYNIEDNNWEGRGPLQDQVISAEIAAYETFIHNWKKEASDKSSTV